MSTRLEILTEERSMEYFLRGLLPRVLPDEYVLDKNCYIHSHSGKSHLMRSIPKKMSAYPRFPDDVKVLIVHDQDSNDCYKLKTEIEALCDINIPHVIRIACRELENWYLGDFEAIEKVFPQVKAKLFHKKAKYRNPDRLNGAEEMKKLTKTYSKTDTARKIAIHMNLRQNKSKSFLQLLQGIRKLTTL